MDFPVSTSSRLFHTARMRSPFASSPTITTYSYNSDFLGRFAKLDSATKRTIKSLTFYLVVSFKNKNSIFV
jgi:hypothetical protein